MSTSPRFRPIGKPLDASDNDLNLVNRKLGVPTLVSPVAPAPEPSPRRRIRRMRPLNVHLPDYVYRAVRDRAHQQESSVRFIVMQALADSGIDIAPADLVEDARRSRD